MRNAAVGLLLVWNILAFAEGPLVFAQEQKFQDEFRKQQAEYWKNQPRQHEKTPQDELGRLKEVNPKLYEQRKKELERQAKINAILKDFHQGKLTDEQSESQLFPLVKEELGPKISALDVRISWLEKQLAFTRSAKQNPDVLIKERIEQLLGRSMADADDAGW